jgi:hypothetical protein
MLKFCQPLQAARHPLRADWPSSKLGNLLADLAG